MRKHTSLVKNGAQMKENERRKNYPKIDVVFHVRNAAVDDGKWLECVDGAGPVTLEQASWAAVAG